MAEKTPDTTESTPEITIPTVTPGDIPKVLKDRRPVEHLPLPQPSGVEQQPDTEPSPTPAPTAQPSESRPSPINWPAARRWWARNSLLVALALVLVAGGLYALFGQAANTPPADQSGSFSGYVHLTSSQPVHLNSAVTITFTKAEIISRDQANAAKPTGLTTDLIKPDNQEVLVTVTALNSSQTIQSPLNSSETTLPEIHLANDQNHPVNDASRTLGVLQTATWQTFANLPPGPATTTHQFIFQLPTSLQPNHLYLTLSDSKFSPDKSYLPLRDILKNP